jgi:hypothetical protein
MAEDIENTLKEFSKIGIFSHNPHNGIGLWEEEQRLLLKLVGKSKKYLEIGSHNLGSALLVGTHANINALDRQIYALDIEFSPWANLNYKRSNSWVVTLETDSNELSKHEHVLKGLDFVFIDGFHSFAQVIKDFENVYPLMTEGIIAFHDTSPFLNKKEHVERCLKFANDNLGELMSDETENFYVDEAIAKIVEDYPVELIDCSVECYHPRETRLNSWIRGKTSPHSAIWAVKVSK